MSNIGGWRKSKIMSGTLRDFCHYHLLVNVGWNSSITSFALLEQKSWVQVRGCQSHLEEMDLSVGDGSECGSVNLYASLEETGLSVGVSICMQALKRWVQMLEPWRDGSKCWNLEETGQVWLWPRKAWALAVCHSSVRSVSLSLGKSWQEISAQKCLLAQKSTKSRW